MPPSAPALKLLEIEWMTTIHQSGTSRSLVAPELPVAINAGEFSVTRGTKIPYAKLNGTGFIGTVFRVESFDVTGDASISVFVGGTSGGPSRTIGRTRAVIAKAGMSTPFMVSTVFTDSGKDFKFIFQGVIINNR
jgi:hypothetical protein